MVLKKKELKFFSKLTEWFYTFDVIYVWFDVR